MARERDAPAGDNVAILLSSALDSCSLTGGGDLPSGRGRARVPRPRPLPHPLLPLRRRPPSRLQTPTYRMEALRMLSGRKRRRHTHIVAVRRRVVRGLPAGHIKQRIALLVVHIPISVRGTASASLSSYRSSSVSSSESYSSPSCIPAVGPSSGSGGSGWKRKSTRPAMLVQATTAFGS